MDGKCRRRQDQCAIWPLCEGGDCALKLVDVARVNRGHLDPERWRCALDCAKWRRTSRHARISKDCNTRRAWRDLLEQFQPFRTKAEFKSSKTSGIAAGPREARNQAGANRVDRSREHDRYAASRF